MRRNMARSQWFRSISLSRTPGIIIALSLIPAVVSGCQKAEPVAQLVAQAQILRDAGKYPEAVIKLETVIARDPKNVAARILTAQIYIDLGQSDAALGLLNRAKEEGAPGVAVAKPWAEAELNTRRYQQVVKDTDSLPDSASNSEKASLLAYRGAALSALNQAAASQGALAQGLELDPHSVDVRIFSTRLAIVHGDLDVARQQLAEAKQESPQDRRVKQEAGDIAYLAKDFAAAEQIFRKILDSEPWNQLARADLAASQLAQDKLTEAAATVDEALNDPDSAAVPKDPMLSHLRAVIAYRQKDYNLSQQYSEYVVSQAPSYEPSRLIAGASSYALKEYERANYYISPYVSQEQQDVPARKLLAAVQLHLNHPGEAAKILSPFRNMGAEDPELLSLIGVAAARSGDLATADRYLKLAVARQPDSLSLRTELGRTEIALGDLEGGTEELEQALRSSPDALGPEIPLFFAYMRLQQYDKALSTAQHLTASAPNLPAGYLLLSSVYLVQGNLEAGRSALLKAREIHPGDVNANRNLAKIALAQGKLDDARGYYEDILKANPQSTGTYIALADLEARANHPQAAEDTLLKDLRANPDDVEANTVLARYLLAEGKAQDALTRAQQALQKRPRDPALLDIIGRAQLALGQHDNALSTFRDLVAVAPQESRAHADLAEAYLAQYTPDHPQWPAINEAAEAVKLDPRDRSAKLVLGRALVTHDRFVEAHEVVTALKQDGTADVAASELEGLVARGEGRLPDAAAAFAQAIAIADNSLDRERLADVQLHLAQTGPAIETLRAWLGEHREDIKARQMLANILVAAGRLDEASKQYAELVNQDPDNPASHNNLAWVMARQGRLDEAMTQARAAVKLAPDSVDALDTFGMILMQSGTPSEAVGPLDKAWQKSSQRADVGFHLSQALSATGKKGEALELLRGVLARGNAFEERAQAQHFLQQLGG